MGEILSGRPRRGWEDTIGMNLKYLQTVCCINIFTSLCKNLFNLLEFLAEAFRCHVHAKNSSKFNKFLLSEANLLIQHIIVQDQDGINKNL